MMGPGAERFVHEPPGSRVVFGSGVLASLPAELDRLGVTKSLILCTPEQTATARRVAELLGRRSAGLFDQAVMHVPLEIAAQARLRAHQLGADSCVAVGGGSTIGLGKAIALEYGLPIVAIPTTYAGSEMTPIWGITEKGAKRTGRDPRVLPRVVLYDPDLTMSLPKAMSVTSGINAIAHGVEALYAPDRNPVLDLMAEEGIRSLCNALPRIVKDPTDLAARSDAFCGSWLCGSVLGATTMSLHHKLCHTLGGSLNLPHAETHTIVLPHAARYNATAAPTAMRRIARALEASDAPAALFDLAASLGAPTALRELGVTEGALDAVADAALQSAYANPRPLERHAIRALLQQAWEGRRPVPHHAQ
jgi:maleylacetate reductase